jgi:hypothetical protein
VALLALEAQRVLEVARVAGVEFVVMVMAACLEAAATVEEHCEALVAQQLLSARLDHYKCFMTSL